MRFRHRHETTWLRGYVLDVGPTFFLLLAVSDRMWFDGFECLRIPDVSYLAPDPTAAFMEKALELRRANRPARPPIDLQSVASILESASVVFPLATIHIEEIDPDVCYIGRVVKVGRKYLTLQEIDPHAVWESRATQYELADITRLGFGQDYEDALYLVGGDPPELGR